MRINPKLVLIAPILVVTSVITGCASVSVEYSEGTFRGESRTLFKDVEAFEAQWGDVDVSLGKSSGPDPRLIACAIAPELCQ